MRRPTALLALVLTLAACDREAEAVDDFSEGEEPVTSEASGADCLVGTWAVDAAHSFRPEMWDNLMPGGEVQFAYGGHDGRALLTFGPDGSTQQTFEDFELSIEAETAVGEILTTVAFDGTADGRYAVEDGALRFTPGAADLSSSARVNMGGREMATALDEVESLFERGERTLTTFTCSGDELLFDIHEAPEGGRVLFDDARYTRVSS